MVDGVNDQANKKIDEMKNFVAEVGQRFEKAERLVPERMQQMESRHEGIIGTINQLTQHLQEKFKELENAVSERPRASPAPSGVPPVPPSFGGPPATEHFNIGSPLSGPPPTQSAAPPLDPWATFAQNRSTNSSGGPGQGGFGPGHPTPPAPAQAAHRTWDPRMWSTADAKVSKELKPFNGTHASYKIWANRVKDHFTKKNPDWHHVFVVVESQKTPVSRDLLKVSWLRADGYTFDVDFGWCANALWAFIGEHVIDTVYNNRNVLAGGHNNGLELWRSLFVKHEGGADQVELGGMGSLHSFPQCDKMDSLQFWVGKWTEMKDAYGAGISDAHLRSMFINILPAAVQKEVREKPGLDTLQKCIDHVLSDLGRLNDAQLSKLHMDRLKQSLSSTQRISPVLDQEEPVEKATVGQSNEDQLKSFINVLSDKMEDLVAAVNQQPRPKARAVPKRAQSDFAKFGDRCLHCGSDKHRARDCPVKKSLMEKNGGKLPQGYKSAFDKWKAKQPKTVAPILDPEDMDDFDEYSETDLGAPLWSLPQCALMSDFSCECCDSSKSGQPIACQPADKPSFEHTNSFQAIFDESDDDEAQVLNAIKQFSAKITVGPKLSQKKRKAQRPIDKYSVSQIAKLVRTGKLNLPDLELESNEDYEAVWALVDSGAARSVARRKTHFSKTVTHLEPSSVRMATASGEELKSHGCFKLSALSTEGNAVVQTFEDADVDMPIMSVGEISSNGELGSNVLFGEHDGHIIDIQTSATSRFHRRRGVYFMKLFVPRNKSADPDFTRPGTA